MYWSILHRSFREEVNLYNNIMMRYAWVSLAILAIWISAVLLLVSDRIDDPEVFYLFIMLITVSLSYIGFRSA